MAPAPRAKRAMPAGSGMAGAGRGCGVMPGGGIRRGRQLPALADSGRATAINTATSSPPPHRTALATSIIHPMPRLRMLPPDRACDKEHRKPPLSLCSHGAELRVSSWALRGRLQCAEWMQLAVQGGGPRSGSVPSGPGGAPGRPSPQPPAPSPRKDAAAPSLRARPTAATHPPIAALWISPRAASDPPARPPGWRSPARAPPAGPSGRRRAGSGW